MIKNVAPTPKISNAAWAEQFKNSTDLIIPPLSIALMNRTATAWINRVKWAYPVKRSWLVHVWWHTKAGVWGARGLIVITQSGLCFGPGWWKTRVGPLTAWAGDAIYCDHRWYAFSLPLNAGLAAVVCWISLEGRMTISKNSQEQE